MSRFHDGLRQALLRSRGAGSTELLVRGAVALDRMVAVLVPDQQKGRHIKQRMDEAGAIARIVDLSDPRPPMVGAIPLAIDTTVVHALIHEHEALARRVAELDHQLAIAEGERAEAERRAEEWRARWERAVVARDGLASALKVIAADVAKGATARGRLDRIRRAIADALAGPPEAPGANPG